MVKVPFWKSPPVHVYGAGHQLGWAAIAGPPENASAPTGATNPAMTVTPRSIRILVLHVPLTFLVRALVARHLDHDPVSKALILLVDGLCPAGDTFTPPDQ